ncbi:uncharacterized protein VNE69_07254 [Vairimorpha necatrix]|uniref:Uncharacterized protein n=1 Tax=Vairimorpha necatrix TaxID=6039 RepID=A0AAX4JDV1_9MICR
MEKSKSSELSYEFPEPNGNIVDTERKIKTYLRKYSINLPVEKDIERFSDKYNESVLVNKETVKNYLYSELMPPEICEYFQFNEKLDVEEIDKENISDLEWDSEEEEEDGRSSEDGDYKITGEDDEDSEASAHEEGDVL